MEIIQNKTPAYKKIFSKLILSIKYTRIIVKNIAVNSKLTLSIHTTN